LALQQDDPSGRPSNFLHKGRLVRPLGDGLAYDFAYYIIHRPHAGTEPGVAAFKEWLLAEARFDE